MTAAGQIGLAAPLLSEAASHDGGNGAGALRHVCGIARAHAEAVDRDGRFPAETVAALREEGLLAALLPHSLGGAGCPLREVAATCYALGSCCSASAMILAMHHIQVASIMNHSGGSAWLRRFLMQVGSDGLLLASVTSEVGVGGDMRSSRCAVMLTQDGRFELVKNASTVSYGAYAGALVITARAHVGAEASNQVLVVIPCEPGVLTSMGGGWDTMGMRGTRSEPFMVRATGETDQIVPEPFARIAAETMVPVSHLLWASIWCGIAADAVTRARMFLRGKMRAAKGAVPDGARRLVCATEQLMAIEARVRLALSDYEAGGHGQSFADAAAINMLKTSVSDTCLAVVEDAMLVCGFAGYSNTGAFSLSRHLRDLHSARLMIHNDRVRDYTARLLIMQSPLLGIG